MDFCTSVFEANVFAQLTEGPVRHALIDLGGGMALHPFEFIGRPADAPYGEIFPRGHLDHVSSRFWAVRTRAWHNEGGPEQGPSASGTPIRASCTNLATQNRRPAAANEVSFFCVADPG